MNGAAVILLVISLAGILTLFYLIKKFKRSIISKGDLKSHSTESAKSLGFTLWPVILLKTDSNEIIANTIPFLRIIIIFLIIRFFKLDYVINLKIKSELRADRISAELGSSEALISALKKMEKYIKELPQSKGLVLLSNVYFAEQPFYPSIDDRIKKLDEFSKTF